MRRWACVFAVISFAVAAVAGERSVRLQVDPPQTVKAIAIRSGAVTVPAPVRDGNVLIPDDLPLPWTVNLARFESTSYSAADAAAGRPLLLRELGRIRAVLVRSHPSPKERFTWIARRSGTRSIQEFNVVVGEDGSFDLAMPAGIYDAVALGETNGTRVRSAIVVKPGAMTDVGTMPCERTVRLTLRVVDAVHRSPVRRATITWDPSGVVNADVARVLYARRWSAVTDAAGAVAFPSIGPLPIAVRWSVAADGYATTWTRPTELHDENAVVLPDVILRVEATLAVRTRLPRDATALRQAMLVFGEPDAANPNRFHAVARVPLREETTKFVAKTYGRKRLWVENASGALLAYRDVAIERETTFVEFTPEPVTIAGTVTRGDKPVENVIVRAADPKNGQAVLAVTSTDRHGAYRLTTWQSGPLFLYATPSAKRGTQAYAIDRTVDPAGARELRADFTLPDAGLRIRVVDAGTGTPLRAMVEKQAALAGGRSWTGRTETDDDGRLVLEGLPDGSVHLSVRAREHYAKELEVPLTRGNDEVVVALERSGAISGIVTDIDGSPIAGAHVSGAYANELAVQGFFEAVTDQSGRFRFDASPAPGTPFYVMAPRHALGITTLQTDHENVVRLSPPGRGGAVLMPDNAPPTQVQMVTAAPAGGELIPMGALYDLAEVNGLNVFQLQGAGLDGTLALPRFLQPGTYTFFALQKGGKPFRYERIGTATLPSDENRVFAYRQR